MKYCIIVITICGCLLGCSAHKNSTIDNSPKITTNQSGKSYAESNILYLVDGQEASRETIELIDPKNIDKIEVIKTKEEILKYTAENYDGIVAIYLKKK